MSSDTGSLCSSRRGVTGREVEVEAAATAASDNRCVELPSPGNGDAAPLRADAVGFDLCKHVGGGHA
jgi:hypothetical protein